jgi:hypothetical protein
MSKEKRITNIFIHDLIPYLVSGCMRKKAEIKVKVHRQKKRIPQQFKILIKFNNQTKMANMAIKPDVPTNMVQNVLRSILTLLDKSYPKEPEKPPTYIM